MNKKILITATLFCTAFQISAQNPTEKDSITKLKEVVLEKAKHKYTQNNPSTSLRLSTELEKIPQNIQVISNALLEDQQVISIMDGITRNVSGVTMLEHWGHFARINMRGFRLPAFRNGINVTDSWGPLAEDMSYVDRIEFVKGPAGFMMSAGEPGGFYNVVTKKPTDKTVAQISAAAGSFDYYRVAFDFGGKLTQNGKLLYRLNGVTQTADTHRGNEDSQRYGLAPSLAYKFSDKTTITTELNFQKADTYMGNAYVFAPTAGGYASLDRNFKFTDTNFPSTEIKEVNFLTNFKHEFSKNWNFEIQYSHLRYDQEGASAWIRGIENSGNAIRYAGIWDALSLGNYAQLYINGKFNTFGVLTHKVLGGLDYTEKRYWADFGTSADIDSEIKPFNIYNPTYGDVAIPTFDRSVPLKDRAGIYTYGLTNKSVYLQDEISDLNNRVRLTLALRYTNLESVGKTNKDKKITPRIGLSADILPESALTVYALYDQSFLPVSGVSKSGASFDPINAKDIEGGLKTALLNGKLKASLGAYRITKQNVLVTDPENNNFSIQLGEIQSKGIEFDLQGEITPELNVVFNYANSDVEITNDTDTSKIGQKVAGFAKHVTNGWLNYNFASTSFLKGFGASLGYQYQVDRSTWSWGADNKTDLPNYFRLDGGLSWQNKKIRVQVNVNNLLNEYLYSGSNYGNYLYWQSEPGTNGRVTLTYKF